MEIISAAKRQFPKWHIWVIKRHTLFIKLFLGVARLVGDSWILAAMVQYQREWGKWVEFGIMVLSPPRHQNKMIHTIYWINYSSHYARVCFLGGFLSQQWRKWPGTKKSPPFQQQREDFKEVNPAFHTTRVWFPPGCRLVQTLLLFMLGSQFGVYLHNSKEARDLRQYLGFLSNDYHLQGPGTGIAVNAQQPDLCSLHRERSLGSKRGVSSAPVQIMASPVSISKLHWFNYIHSYLQRR